MGTRRSKHNKGRKPLYKDFRTNLAPAFPQAPSDIEILFEKFGGRCCYCDRPTKIGFVSDSLQATKDHRIPLAHRGADDLSNWALACFQCSQDKADSLPTPALLARLRLNGRYPRVYAKAENKTVELEADVVSFLEKRRQVEALRVAETAKLKRHNLCVVKAPEFVPLGMIEADRFGVSPYDILLQMYDAKEICFSLFRTGRRWQLSMERATIQPGRSIDWSVIVQNQAYQRKGDLTRTQWMSHIDRREIVRFAGEGFVESLDRCLALDVGRRKIVAILECSYPQARDALIWLLRRLEDAINCLDYWREVS